jgi:energy-coupling factor transporter ATP-binding protein EcfA2
MSLLQLDRQDWLENYFDYNDGEHAVAIEPTGGGKSTIMYQMAQQVIGRYPHLSFVTFMPKPADATTSQWAAALHLRETPVWPPEKKFAHWFQPKPRGHVLWPHHRMDLPPAERREEVGKVLRAGLDGLYIKGNSISFVDDAHSAATYMRMNDYIEETLVNGRANAAAIWLALQKPSGTANSGGITTYAYNSPTHFLFGKDTNEANLKRLSEIGGGIDPAEIAPIIRNLRLYRFGKHTISQKLYVDKRGPFKALIGP